MRSRSATGRPSSTMNPAESATGRAPAIARSLTVPFTASSPMSPPGKKRGRTTNESVVNASRPSPSPRTALSASGSSSGLRSSRRNSASIRSWLDLPPAPCERVICSSSTFRRGRRRRASIASRTSSSERPAPDPFPAIRSLGRRRPRRPGRRRPQPVRRPPCAGGAEHLALPGLDHALEHLAALAGLRVGDPHTGDLVADLGVPVGELPPQLQRALGDEPEPAPLEGRPQLHRLCDRLQRQRVALLADHAAVLVLDLGAPLAKLAEDHVDAL